MKIKKIRQGRYQVNINGQDLIINKYPNGKGWGIYELIDGEWESNWIDSMYRTPTKRDTLKVIDKMFGSPEQGLYIHDVNELKNKGYERRKSN